jgi:hypothetical protein
MDVGTFLEHETTKHQVRRTLTQITPNGIRSFNQAGTQANHPCNLPLALEHEVRRHCLLGDYLLQTSKLSIYIGRATIGQ